MKSKYYTRIKWTNSLRPTILSKRKIFRRNIYASFDTFWVQIAQLFDQLSVLEDL